MKTTKFNFKKENGLITSIESNEIITSKTHIKFDNQFYSVVGTYFDMSTDGNAIYVHNCELVH